MMRGEKPEVGGVRRPVPDEPHARHLRDALLALAAVLTPAGGGGTGDHPPRE
jgi:hypothetical protein